MRANIHLISCVFLLSSVIFTGCLPDAPTGPSLWEELNSNTEYSIFVDALELTGFDEELQESFVYTLFVPTNDAFESWFEANNYADLSAVDLAELRYLIRYHMVLGEVDIAASAAGYVSTMSPASPDSNGLLIYVETTGNGIELNGSVAVTEFNITARNGLINEVEAVLNTPSLMVMIRSNDTFSMFEDAIVKGGLVSRLQSLPIVSTVLVPTNSAFEDFLDDENLDEIDDLSTDEIKELVKTHIFAENLTFQTVIDISNGTYTNLEGDDIKLTSFQDGQMIVENTIGVPRYDIHARNGVIHVISSVINPF